MWEQLCWEVLAQGISGSSSRLPSSGSGGCKIRFQGGLFSSENSVPWHGDLSIEQLTTWHHPEQGERETDRGRGRDRGRQRNYLAFMNLALDPDCHSHLIPFIRKASHSPARTPIMQGCGYQEVGITGAILKVGYRKILINILALGILVHISLLMQMFCYHLNLGIQGVKQQIMPNCFPKLLNQFTLQEVVYKSFWNPTSLLILGICLTLKILHVGWVANHIL